MDGWLSYPSKLIRGEKGDNGGEGGGAAKLCHHLICIIVIDAIGSAALRDSFWPRRHVGDRWNVSQWGTGLC